MIFCIMKVVLSKMNLQVWVFHIRLYAFRFEGNIVLVNGRYFFDFVGAQLWNFLMGRQHVIIEICMYNFASNSMIFCIMKIVLSKINSQVSVFSCQTICFQIWRKDSTSKWPLFFWLCWCATLDIFHGPAACHYWDMHVKFCIKFHDFLHHESSAFKN